MAGSFLDGFAHVVVAIDVKDVGDQVESILIILYLGVQTRQVEPIGQVLLVDLAKVLVSSRGNEL